MKDWVWLSHDHRIYPVKRTGCWIMIRGFFYIYCTNVNWNFLIQLFYIIVLDEWFVEYRGNTTVPPSNISDIPKLSVTFNNPTKWRNISFWYLRRGDLQSSVVFTLAAIKVDRMGNVSIPEMIWNSKADKKNYWKWRLAKVSIPFDGNVMVY